MKGYIPVKGQELNPESKHPSGFQEGCQGKAFDYAALSFLLLPGQDADAPGDNVRSISCLFYTCLHERLPEWPRQGLSQGDCWLQ